MRTSLLALTIPDNSYVLKLIRLFFVDNWPNTQIDTYVRYFFMNIETSSCIEKMHSITFHTALKTDESSSECLLAKELNTHNLSVALAISQCFVVFAYAAIFCMTSSL